MGVGWVMATAKDKNGFEVDIVIQVLYKTDHNAPH